MTENAIVVEHLSKRYLIGHRSSSGRRYKYAALRDVIGREVRNFARKAVDVARGRQVVQGDEIEEFWALKDVSFEVKQGEIVGIIGRNGAGKSTLLKVLSRITEPTEGRVTLRGRVSSLLEVGTGFHPELTGRENIFLNGAILGMTRQEIRKKFDEIVAFAEVEKFIDTPVKHYSSGMYVRLAFAVAAHLEPEILIVDEVLAVGDTEFQKKCLGKMDEVSRLAGRTVFFVSHNLAAINELTRRVLLFDSGRIVADASTNDAVTKYLSRAGGGTTYTRSPAQPTSRPHIYRAEVVTSEGNGIHRFGEPLEVRFWVKHDRPMEKACLAFKIMNQFQQRVVYAWAYHPEIRFGDHSGETVLKCRFPSLQLNVGKFYLRVTLDQMVNRYGEIYEELDGVCAFEVIRTDSHPWGWHPEVCAYHEKWAWVLDESTGQNELDKQAQATIKVEPMPRNSLQS
jgi:lipopolysaccharide transport system ATP-binding protein